MVPIVKAQFVTESDMTKNDSTIDSWHGNFKLKAKLKGKCK